MESSSGHSKDMRSPHGSWTPRRRCARRRRQEARPADAQYRETAPASHGTAEKLPEVVSLSQRRLMDPAAVIAGLPRDTRPLPPMDRYEHLQPKRAAKLTVDTTDVGANTA